MVIVVVSGSRYLTEPDVVKSVLNELFKDYPNGTLIHGGAKGVDSFAGKLAKEAGYEVIVCLAEWDKYGKSAGPIRNKKMIDDYSPDLLIAFPIPESRGTYQTIEYAKKKKLYTEIHIMTNEGIKKHQ